MEKQYIIDLDDLTDNQYGSTTGKIVKLADNIDSDIALSLLLQDSSTHIVTSLDKKTLVKVDGGIQLDSHYYLERRFMVKRDIAYSNHRYSIDLSDILSLIILRGITHKVAPKCKELDITENDFEAMSRLSKLLYGGCTKYDLKLYDILNRSQLIDCYISNLVEEVSAGLDHEQTLMNLLQLLIEDFNDIKRRLLVYLRGLDGIKVISIGYGDILIDSTINNLCIILKYRDQSLELPIIEIFEPITEAI